MELSKLKQEMKALWKENFHDSDQYIDLIFDAYFDEEMVEYDEENGQVVSALLGINYTFGIDKNKIQGVYICGLSTKNMHRKEGRMTRLIERISARMAAKGAAFIFLIPANEGLVKYYADRGFVPAFYKFEQRYTPVHSFRRDFASMISADNPSLKVIKERYYSDLEIDCIRSLDFKNTPLEDRMVEFILGVERGRKDFFNFQNEQNIRVFLREAVISSGRIYLSKTSYGTITGIVITSITEKEISDKGRYLSDRISLYRIYDAILADNGDRTLSIENPQQRGDEVVWEPAYVGVLPESPVTGAVAIEERVYNPSRHSKLYGMLRILNLYEILKFQATNRKDLKYSILVKEGKTEKISRYMASKGNVRCEDVEKGALGSAGMKVMSLEEVGRILFRRGGGDWIVNEALELPSMQGTISLMLD